MRKHRIIALAGIVLAVAATAAWRLWPRTVPMEECSEAYRRYADSEHVVAAFLRDFPVNDTVCVDVTLLEARDSLGWERLQKDFNVTPPPPEVMAIIDSNSVNMWYAPRRDYSLPKDSCLLNNDILALSYGKKTLSIFKLDTESQIDAILKHQIINTH